MNTKHLFSAILTVLLAAACSSDKSDVRTMRYYPDGRDIVCFNGDGRYNRALYGTNTKFRLETSDTPIFAAYGDGGYNFRFYLVYDGKETQLDLADECKASYQGGRRVYELKDRKWGDAEVEIYSMASFFSEGAIWRFRLDGFDGPVTLKARKCNMASTKFHRNGDLGMDPRESFEPAADEAGLQVLEWEAGEESYCIFEHNSRLYSLAEAEGKPVFEKEEAARQELMGRVEINTPDPYFNTLGANLVHAADGTWDGETFLHGAIGWRTALAGWRGAYAGDALGWNDRAISHFRLYSQSMITDIPPVMDHPQQDPRTNLASSLKEWGSPIYSNGYITRRPGHKDEMSHYDMNLNYIDELMWHFCYDADPEFMREMWPYIKLHHEWEKRNFDPDGDHLYDAYCCIWASDALYYNAGAVTHSSAYNYRSNLLTARIAEIIGEDPTPYRNEAEAILKAMNERLWMEDRGHWAEYQDYMGLKRLHKSAAVWSIYTPIDCGAGTPEQFYRATRYVDHSIPHIPVRYKYDRRAVKALELELPKPEKDLFTISTTDWLPYVWSTNNVAHEEVANMALAYLQAGRNDSGFQLLKADIIDEMYLGACPGNFGQISYYDKAKNEAYRDFADNVGITSRAIVNGLFGILPDALNGQCVVKPAFPDEWEEASIKTPHLSYSFRREGNKDIYEIEQNFTRPLRIVVRANAGGGAYLEVAGSNEAKQTIVVDRRKLPKALKHKDVKFSKADSKSKAYLEKMGLGDISRRAARNSRMIDISEHFNSNADDIFKNEYLTPRPPYSSLQLPKQGVGEWCIPHETHVIEDDGLRSLIRNGVFDTGKGVSFLTPEEGHNIIYTSLWDNYPDEVTVDVSGKARYAYLLMAGSTQNMQSRIENGVVVVSYKDGSSSEMYLENPINWRPIEQDCYTDELAFYSAGKNPYRVAFKTGEVARKLDLQFKAMAENNTDNTQLKLTDRIVPDGAGILLKMPLDKNKEIESLTLRTLSNDVVIGLMAITLEL